MMTKQHEKQHNEKFAQEEDIDNTLPEDEIDEETQQQDELSRLKEENAKLKDSFLRAYAESENTKKRCQQEIEKNAKYAISSFAKELLTVADDLQRALSSVADENKEACKSLLEGIELTQNELTHVFDKFGIKKVDSLNKIFDPNLERVVQEVEDPEKPAGTIISELQSAYTINDRILREAMVVVTKGGPKK
jgi:molecular chaperone GrpE